jgi:predicted NodU family carbamoyl transferase
MNVFSFSNEHDAGAAIVQNGTIIAAINEERLLREKNQTGLPALSIGYLLKTTSLKPTVRRSKSVQTGPSKVSCYWRLSCLKPERKLN